MPSNILQFPNSDPQAQLHQKIQEIYNDIPPEAEHTDAYPMFPHLVSNQQLKQVPDLETGGQRTRRWGCMFGISALPGLNESGMNVPQHELMPMKFLDADNLDALKARIYHEVEAHFESLEVYHQFVQEHSGADE